jgi:hypothetical protein
MAATTISRATWTDGASPTGTLINNARLQGDVYDKIDALIAGAITFGGTVSSEAFGTHSISAGGTGDQVLRVRNSSAGTTNRAYVGIGNDAGADRNYLIATSSTYTPSGAALADGFVVGGSGAGGISIFAGHASGAVRLYAGGSSTARLTVAADGGATFTGGIVVNNNYPTVTSYNTGGGADEKYWRLVNNATTFYLGAINDAFAVESIALTIARSGTTIGALTYSGTQVRFPAGTPAAPGVAFTSYTSHGLVPNTNSVAIVTNGAPRLEAVGTSTANTVWVYGGAFGAGAVGGPTLVMDRNSSGSGAASRLVLSERGSTLRYFWVDAGLLRIHTAGPTESDSVSHTAGSVVGDQTSTLAAKTLLGQPHDADLLAAVLGTPVHHFRYRDGRYNGETFTGIVTDESPHFGKDEGRALNEINGLGYLIGAVRALAARITALETSC